MSDHLHIVCLDAPSPPDYGGAIDMFYKITSLAGTGKKIILHYFNYNKKRNADLIKNICIEVNVYKRKNFLRSFSFSNPYIVGSRINSLLIDRLNKDNHPILLEGIHCSGIIPYLNNPSRVVLRMHNDEANYYKSLANIETDLFKKIYYSREASLLKDYQEKLDANIKIACLSMKDVAILKNEYGFTNLHFIPCFIPWQIIHSQQGKGNYCLYHGNMAIAENEAAAVWLLKNVFCNLSIPFVIAGKNISQKLIAIAKKYKNCRLINNPPIDELNGLIKDAHVNLLPSKNNTGVKLKLLHALFEGRFCITNDNGLEGSQITSGVHIANTAEEYIKFLTEIFELDFTDVQIEERKNIQSIYNNQLSAQQLSELW